METENKDLPDQSALLLIKQRIESAEKSIAAAKKLLNKALGGDLGNVDSIEERVQDLTISNGGKIVEGIFDGQNMIGPDKRQYPVPANYASKSKLVEGDILKLTISDDGSFIYKQIGPVERLRVQGELKTGDGGGFLVQAEKREYRVLLASVTYFKAKEGDNVTLIVPASDKATWGAIENVLKPEVGKKAETRPEDDLSKFENPVDDFALEN